MDPISSERWHQIDALLAEALDLGAGMQRVFLDTIDDTSLRDAVEHLLAAEAAAPAFLSAQAVDYAVPFLSDLSDAFGFSGAPAGGIIGPYEVLARLGGGGMGVVYRARDTRLGRTVALKFLPPHLSADDVAKERFLGEARAAARLDHPNICTVYDVGEAEDGQLFIAMACYEGETLEARITRGSLTVEEALDVARQIARGLAAAHTAGIVHRDVKPANVMLSGEGVVKILDFGVAEMADLNLSRSGATWGTVAYMSPERTRSEEASDSRIDLWSLGVVLYEMLAGERPFQGDQAAVIYAIRHDEPAPLTGARPEVPAPLARLVHRLLEKDPSARPANADDVATALRRLLHRTGKATPEPVEAATRFPLSASARDAYTAGWGVRTSIAVLPFADMSPGRDQDYFCEGLAEELINALTRIEGLHVASRTSSLAFRGASMDVREIGERLQVGTVLEGSVRKSGDRLRVTVQLIDAADGYHIWSERYDGGVEDIFAVQDEIAEHTVRALRGVLSDTDQRALQKAPAADIRAYDYYLRGRQFLHQVRRSGLDHARQLFNRAIEIDPGYAPAHAALAFCSYYRYQWFGRAEADREEADRSSRQAVNLAPELAESHLARGLALSLNERYDEAQGALERALRLNPNLYEVSYFYARVCFEHGDLDRAAMLFERASAIDPHEYQATCLLPHIYHSLGRTESVRAQVRKGLARLDSHLELNPDDVRAVYFKGTQHVRLGETEQGLPWIHRALAMEPDDPVVIWCAACAFSLAGAHEEALDYLEIAAARGIANRAWIEQDSDMDPLRDHPRFQALVEAMA